VLARTFGGSSIALAALLAVGQPARAASGAHQPPGISIWTKPGNVYRRSELVQVFLRTQRDAYVTVLRVDTKGRVRVLFPAEPGDSNLVRGGDTVTVPGFDDQDAFVVDDPAGAGYLYAVASQDPFDYDAFTENDHWSLEAIASLSDGRLRGDPSASLQDLVQQIMQDGYADYDTQLLPYHVEQRPDSSSIVLAAPSAAGQLAPADSGAHQPPGVRIWTNHGDVYQQTERAQVFFRTERDAYVTVLRVNTDGRVRVLFPPEPGDPNLAHGGQTYTVPGVDGRNAFIVDDPPGLGYVFAVASEDPFAYEAFTANDQWSLQTVAGLSDGRIHGDPYASLQALVQQIMPAGYADFGTQLLPYDVAQRPDDASIALAAPRQTGQVARGASREHQVPYDAEQRNDGASVSPETPLADGQPAAASGEYPLANDVPQGHPYPRFLCYDCHAYTPYASWNPYSAWCPRFSLAVYYNPFYSPGYGYPARYYGGNNVVYARPGLAGRQYFFRTRAEQAAPYAVYRNRAGGRTQQPLGSGVRAVDVGGVGSVPAPGGRRMTGGGLQQAPTRAYIAQGQRQRGVYIDPGMRQTSTPRWNAVSGAGQRGNQGYIPQASRQGSRGAYMDPGARQRNAQPPTGIGRSYEREGQRHVPQAASRQGSRGAPGYGGYQGSRSMRGYEASRAPRSGHAPGGGGRGSSSPSARAAPGGHGRGRR
jgi:hypothetical protein